MNKNKNTEQFISDFKSLLAKHNITLKKEFDFDGFDTDVKWRFWNDADWSRDEIYLTMDDIHKLISK